METKNPSTARSDKRRAELSAIAQKYGFSSWSAMLTAIKNGKAEVSIVKKAFSRENSSLGTKCECGHYASFHGEFGCLFSVSPTECCNCEKSFSEIAAS